MNKPGICMLFITLSLLFSCAGTKINSMAPSNNPVPVTKPAVSDTPVTPAGDVDYERVLKGSIGLIVLSDRHDVEDHIRIYNPDGSLWLKIIFTGDEGWITDTRESAYGTNGFKPIILDGDNGALVLKCAGQDKTRYEVFVDEEIGLKKYVKKDDKTFKFQTWEEYALGMFSIGFDEKTNPIRETPKGTEKTNVPEPLKETFFRPVEIKGEWMKIEWDKKPAAGSKAQTDSGWIKWRDSENLVVELFHTA